MWCELVLNGIGGKTISEAKENMTYQEFLTWASYINKRGSLSITGRMEYGHALIATILSNVNGNKKKITDFMPHYEKQEMVVSDNIQDAFGILKSVAKPKEQEFRLKPEGV